MSDINVHDSVTGEAGEQEVRSEKRQRRHEKQNNAYLQNKSPFELTSFYMQGKNWEWDLSSSISHALKNNMKSKTNVGEVKLA